MSVLWEQTWHATNTNTKCKTYQCVLCLALLWEKFKNNICWLWHANYRFYIILHWPIFRVGTLNSGPKKNVQFLKPHFVNLWWWWLEGRFFSLLYQLLVKSKCGDYRQLSICHGCCNSQEKLSKCFPSTKMLTKALSMSLASVPLLRLKMCKWNIYFALLFFFKPCHAQTTHGDTTNTKAQK